VIENLPPELRARILVDDCWIWTGGITSKGYGKVMRGSKRKSVHVVVYTLLIGPISAGNELHHTCRNRRCCNPAHLQSLTRAEHNKLEPRGTNGNEKKTHCPKGHPYDEANTYLWHNARYCRACTRERIRT
jgi:hypothetical protein